MTYRFDFQDYESARRSFKIPVPEYFNFGFDVIDKHAGEENKRALVWTDASGSVVKEYTFRDISRLSNQAANALKSLGVKKGDRVFIMLGRVPEWYCILVACHKLGAVIMPAPVISRSSLTMAAVIAISTLSFECVSARSRGGSLSCRCYSTAGASSTASGAAGSASQSWGAETSRPTQPSSRA